MSEDSQIKVLDVRDSPWHDGPGRTIIEVAVGLRQRGIEISVSSFVNPGIENADYLDVARKNNLITYEIQETSMFDKRVLEQIISICLNHNIDIIHSHEFRSNVYGLYVSRKLKLPLISTAHGWVTNNIKRKVFAVIDKLLLSFFFDKVIAVSGSVKGKIYASIFPVNKIVTVHNTLDTKQYRIHHDGQIRRRYNIPDDVTLIAKIGRLSPEKRQANLIAIMRKLLDKGHKCCLLLIGVGPDEAKLKSLVDEFNLHDSIIFTGFIKDMQPVYSEVDLVVQASSTEGLPNVILESMLMRVPVIATDVGGTSEVIDSDKVGTLIPPDNDQEMFENIERFLVKPEQFSIKLDAAESRIREQFDSEIRLTKMADIYRSVIKPGKI
ncbi:MAG: glycosyltransferase family 4 protein [Candidatus Thiodiazotropha sp.]